MLRLKENPVEWIKFTAVMGVSLNLATGGLWWHGLVPAAVPLATLGLATAAVVAAMAKPACFRGFYRAGMRVSYEIGQVFGKILLALFFVFLVTPLGLFLRLIGKDLLGLKRAPGQSSYWRATKTNREFDRMF
jgi:hypothetical protein